MMKPRRRWRRREPPERCDAGGMGSATASTNPVHVLQVATARALDFPIALMAAAQGVRAAIDNAVVPHNIIAGAATAGLSGLDGEVLARTMGSVLAYAAGVGSVVFIAADGLQRSHAGGQIHSLYKRCAVEIRPLNRETHNFILAGVG